MNLFQNKIVLFQVVSRFPLARSCKEDSETAHPTKGILLLLLTIIYYHLPLPTTYYSLLPLTTAYHHLLLLTTTYDYLLLLAT